MVTISGLPPVTTQGKDYRDTDRVLLWQLPPVQLSLWPWCPTLLATKNQLPRF